MRFLIIGLGIYGANLATDLTAMGHEVIGADLKSSLVEGIKDFISTAYIIDSTDETSLSVLPLLNVDLVIVAIGENFGASVKTVALLKKNNVKKIYARAIDPLHESILRGIGVDRILTPEQRAASDLVNEMAYGPDVGAMRVDDDHLILKFRAPEFMVGTRYADLDLESTYGVKLVAVTRDSLTHNVIGLSHMRPECVDIDSDSDLRVEATDTFTCFGTLKSFHRLAPDNL